MRPIVVAIAAGTCLITACTGSSARSAVSPTQPAVSTTQPAGLATGAGAPMLAPVDRQALGRPACAPPSPFGPWQPGGGLPETKGTGVGGAQLYGLVMPAAGLPLRVGEQIKIVWRMTGHGPLVATATSPSGAPLSLVFGPAEHSSSDYQRPGDEWGTGYLFPSPGCWHLHFSRDDTQADAWFRIVAV